MPFFQPLIRSFFLLFLTISGFAEASSRLEHYQPTYGASREAFLKLLPRLKARATGTTSHTIRIPSRTDSDLTLDVIYVPPLSTSRGLVVLSSGVHGIEGFTGSAIQRLLIEEGLVGHQMGLDRQHTGYLFLHSVNPYGFKNSRRPDENNVDLNRNFGDDVTLFQTKSPGYRQLNSLLNPTGPASAGMISHGLFLLGTLRSLVNTSYDTLNQTIAGGQYEFPKGIFYGGNKFAPQREITLRLLNRVAADYSQVMILDFHTGYGKRGTLHLLPNPPDSQRIAARWKKVFGSYPIENVESEDFYSNEGDFSTFASRFLESKGKKTVPMLVEYGTLNSHQWRGAVGSLSRAILENQMHWYGAKSKRSARRIRQNYREMFYPSSGWWRKKVMEDSAKWLPIFIRRFSKPLAF